MLHAYPTPQLYGLITMYLNVIVPAAASATLFVFRKVTVAVFAALQVADFTTTVWLTE
jgi:hypothetical protein